MVIYVLERLWIGIQWTTLTSFRHLGATFVDRKPLRILVYSYEDIQKVMAWIFWYDLIVCKITLIIYEYLEFYLGL